MPTKTPAEIPTEAIAAQQTDYEPLLQLERIHPHPSNPRHHAVADDELIESIRDQGLIHDLVVAPHPDLEGEYRLIDGHRRYDALTRIGHTFASAKIRRDLVDDASQLAAMLATIRRADLTPIEEAEGFDLLSELGWNLERIAAATGRAKSTITARRRLLHLSTKAKNAVEAGQVTIDDALAIAALPEAEQKAVEKDLNTGSFRFTLKQAQERAARQAEVDKQRAAYLAAGIPERDMPKNSSIWILNHADHGMVRLGATFSTEPEDHHGCLAFVDDGTRQYPSLELVCTDPANHDDQLTDAQRKARDAEAAAQAEREQRQQEYSEQRERRRLAGQLRCDAIVGAIKPTAKLDPVLEQIIRLGLPAQILLGDVAYDESFQDLAGVPDEQRWQHYPPNPEYMASFATMTTRQLIRQLAAYLVDTLDGHLEVAAEAFNDADDFDRQLAVDYAALLATVGHERNDVDAEMFAGIAAQSEAEEQAS